MTPSLRVALIVNMGLIFLKTVFGIGNAVSSAVSAVAGTYAVAKIWTGRPSWKVRGAINAVYKPPEKKNWTGSESVRKAASAFLSADPSYGDKILVLEDPTKTVIPMLINNMLRGQKRVLAPALDKMMLEEALSKKLKIDMSLESLDDIAGRVSAAMKADPQPVRIILNIPDKATERDILNILSDAKTLKYFAGDNIIIIVAVPRPELLKTLPPTLLRTLSIVG